MSERSNPAPTASQSKSRGKPQIRSEAGPKSGKTSDSARRFPIGAEVLGDDSVSFRVWAPKRRSVQLEWRDPETDKSGAAELVAQGGGYFEGIVGGATAGTLYGFRLDGGTRLFPDLASRFQPDGPTGLSQVVDPRTFRWRDDRWRGVEMPGQVIYELHVGTFTREGTWESALAHLPELKEAGMTVLEVMPVNDFPGTFGWGYDGVCLFAPMRIYGTPDDFRRFVDAAHSAGLGVILDVVYNHFGSITSFEWEYSDEYRSKRYKNEWGSPINFDDRNCGPVREFFHANVRYWIEEFHLDGFRFDATQSIYDSSQRHILAELAEITRAAAGPRKVILLAENEPQNVDLVRPVSEGGFGLDALCNDDFHHTARVRLSGSTEAYFSDYLGSAEELRTILKEGFLYQGQISQHQHQRRGTCSRGLPATAFVHFLQNHDQVANSLRGARIHELTSPGRFRAMTALWLLSPQTPMFFQGQEFSASTPFQYFADIQGSEGKTIAEGRLKFLAQFPSLDTQEARETVAVPSDRATFERSKLDWSERERNRQSYELHRDLLTLRREEPVFCRQRNDLLEGAALNPDCLVVRLFDDGRDVLMLVNFGRRFLYSPSPQPLLASPRGKRWNLLWSSESVRYGGLGTPAIETAEGWRIPAEAAVVLRLAPGVRRDPLDRDTGA